MRSTLDSYLGIHTQALALEAARTNVLAANLANVDTPNYKARDLDFKSAMAAAGGEGVPGTLALAATNPADLNSAGVSAGADACAGPDASAALGAPVASGAADTYQPFLKYRVPLAPSLDGNTVDEQLEESAFAQNSVRYQATLTFLNVKLRDLLTAISSQ
jgi:flagellar basal-body rod protein FlgB